jgi:hypothetical protein
MSKRNDLWVCTKCLWEGVYSLTKGVMYRGIDWQHCPSCNSIVIPLLGKDAVLTNAMHLDGKGRQPIRLFGQRISEAIDLIITYLRRR